MTNNFFLNITHFKGITDIWTIIIGPKENKKVRWENNFLWKKYLLYKGMKYE